MNLGYSIYFGLESNAYLNKIYNAILDNHAISLLGLSLNPVAINIDAALQFADVLSKSNHPNPKIAESHKVWGQEIVAVLYEEDLTKPLEKRNPAIRTYLSSVLSSVGNYHGMHIKGLDHRNESVLDLSYSTFSKDVLRVPYIPKNEEEKFFFHSQRQAIERFNDPYFSFSGPTSMGKSLVMQTFIKEQVHSGKKANLAIIVPTKALINEMYHDLIAELKEVLVDKNYRVISSAGALQLDFPHNFIFVLTPERLLYLLIKKRKYNREIPIDYLFIDEAHKISSIKDSRSPFYYKNIDLLLRRPKKPHIIFASPNIPNPQVYLGLIPDAKKLKHTLASAFSPVSQFKYFLDFIDGGVKVFNSHSQELRTITTDKIGNFNDMLRRFYDKRSSSLVYVNNRDEAIVLYAFGCLCPRL